MCQILLDGDILAERLQLRCKKCGNWVDLDKDNWDYNKEETGIQHDNC